jgi:hypothetical protein
LGNTHFESTGPPPASAWVTPIFELPRRPAHFSSRAFSPLPSSALRPCRTSTWQRLGEAVSARAKDELPRDREHPLAARRPLPQPPLREHAQDLPDAGLQITHGLWGMGQMMFTKYIVVVDDDADVHKRPPSPLPPLRQHRPATRQHLHQRPGRRARLCHLRARRRHQPGPGCQPETPWEGLPPPLAPADQDG